MIFKEDNNDIIVFKWRESRDVKMLWTKSIPIMVPYTSNIRNIRAATTSQHWSQKLKPLVILVYNKGKCEIDYSDQMISYATTIRKGLEWYRKLGIHLLVGIVVVDAPIIYKRLPLIIKFRELLTLKLLELGFAFGQKIIRTCKLCYSNKKLHTDKTKYRKDTTFRQNCPDQLQLYMDCFKPFQRKYFFNKLL